MVDLAGREADVEAFRTLLPRVPASQAAPEMDEVSAVSTRFLRGDTTALDAALSLARRSPDAGRVVSRDLARWTRDLEAAARIGAAATESDAVEGLDAAVRHELYATLGLIEAGRGRWRAAVRAFDRAGPRGEALKVACAMTPFLPVPRETLLELRRAVAGWDSVMPELSYDYSARALTAHRRLYALGMLSVRLDDDEAALRHADALERAPVPGPLAELAAGYARSIRAHAAWRAGRHGEAVETLGPPHLSAPFEFYYDALLNRNNERLLHAVLLQETGSGGDALPWLEHGFANTPTSVLFFAPSHLRRAEIHDANGEYELAREHYGHFLRLWRDADPALQPQLEDARRRLDAVSERTGAETPERP